MTQLFLILSILLFLPQEKNEKITAGKMIKSDHLGNVYVMKNNTLIKTSEGLKKSDTYDWQSNGDISYIDVSDPMRIILFSESSNSAVFLDKNLSIITGPFLLDDAGLFDVSVMCTATQGGFWVFHNSSRQILHIDIYGEANINSGAVDTYKGLPDKLIEKNRKLYLGYENQGIMVFDIWASYEKIIPLKYDNSFIIKNDIIYYQKGNKIYSLNTDTLGMNKKLLFDNKENSIIDFTINEKKLLIISEGKEIHEYQI